MLYGWSSYLFFFTSAFLTLEVKKKQVHLKVLLVLTLSIHIDPVLSAGLLSNRATVNTQVGLKFCDWCRSCSNRSRLCSQT